MTGINEWGMSDTDVAIAYVFEMNLDISGVSDDDEEDPGGYICVNDDDLAQITLSYEPSSLPRGGIELSASSSNIKVWSSPDKGTLVIPDGSNLYKRWYSPPSTLYVEGCSPGEALLYLRFMIGSTYPGGQYNPDIVKFTVINVEMQLDKVGDTTIESGNNYSENTTIRVTAVNAANGQTCTWFTSTVNIAEDTSDPQYEEIYSQNGGYLPSSIPFTGGDNGVKTFIAKSLAGPRVERYEPPDPAKIITTNYDVYDADYLLVPQWVDVEEVHDMAEGGVYDWFETRLKDIFNGASGDVATVLETWSYYDQDLLYWHGQIVQEDWDHESPSGVHLNPHFTETRLDTEYENYCGVTVEHDLTHTVMHEGRHCYQDYLSSRTDLGNDDIPGKPDNDDDVDWLVDVVQISPDNYIVDTTASRSTCAGNKSFKGDDDKDSYGGNVLEALEKDAAAFAEQHD